MRKEKITEKEAICIMIIFHIGSSFILGTGGEAKNDAWLGVIVGILVALPMAFAYARICSLFPEKGLYDILEIVFGKVIGKIVSVFFIWYSFHLGALVLRNFGEFINVVGLPETPLIVPLLGLGMVIIVAVRAGIEVIGRISAYVFPLLLFIMFFVQVVAIPQLELNFLKPILGNGISPVIKAGFSSFTFPFGESILLIGIFFSLKTNKSAIKVYWKGTVYAGLLLLMIVLRNTLILGGYQSKAYFPAYVAVSRISLGDFLQRIELTVAFVLIFGTFIKSGVCLLVTCLGVAKLFNLSDYRSTVIQIGLLMVYFSFTIYTSIIEMRNWAFQVYPYYAIPFQVIIPILLLITAEIKVRVNKKNQ